MSRAFLSRWARRLGLAKDWLAAQLALVVLRTLRLLPVDTALDLADRASRRLGPWLGRHRVALDNLRRAFPEKGKVEIDAIASDMWGNMARLAVEYVFLDSLFDYDPDASTPGRVEVSGEDHFRRIAADPRPHILFTAHLGNFELLPIAGATLGMKITALFRPPNNPFIARYIQSTRSGQMGELLASRIGASFALSRILEEGGNIGLLVDQKFRQGLPTNFFGRECESSPLLPKLVRHHECEVYPARCTRLPGNRFRLQIEDRIALPRDADGRIELGAAAQLLNDIVERWIREDPGQWMWFHKRWGRTSSSRSGSKRRSAKKF